MNIKATVLGSFVADSLALGAHWIYDTEEIKKTFGVVETLQKPLPTSYHPNKEKGEFTHYGDQTFVLLKSLAYKKGFDIDDFAVKWKQLFKDYNDYVDHATTDTLKNFDAGKASDSAGSESGDLAGAARIAPLVYLYKDDLKKLQEVAMSQTKMTHTTKEVVDSAKYFATVAYYVLHGENVIDALKKAGQEEYETAIVTWANAALETVEHDTTKTIEKFGQSCSVAGGFPSVVHLLAKYHNNFKQGVIECVMAGGDSAGRGLVVGMILGAVNGMDEIPKEWLNEMKHNQEITKLLDELSK